MKVRNTAKAIIIRDNKLLVVKKKLEHIGIYYTLPGGGQEQNEVIEETIRRECKEELNTDITVKGFLCVREYISKNHEYSFLLKEVHALEFIFFCEIESVNELTNLQTDVAQVGYEWLEIEDIIEALKQIEERTRLIFPRTLSDLLKEYFIKVEVKSYSRFIF